MSDVLLIDRLGHQGDGVADTAEGPAFVPFTLPGERVRVARDGNRVRFVEVVEPAPQRRAPACRHFTICGGCSLQHLDAAAYLAFKRDVVAAELAGRGIDVEVAATVPAAGPGGRRRVTLTARRTGADIALGFHGRGSHTVVAIEECPVAAPAIVAALPRLKELARRLAGPREPLKLTVTATPAGLDVAAAEAKRLDGAARLRLVAETERLGLARLSVDGEVIAAPRPPAIDVDGVPVIPPPGGFLQATAAAERALAGLVVAGVGKARRIADLFAGIGTFSLPLARVGTVTAVEGDKAAAEALAAARRLAADRHPIAVEARDLFRRPLMGKELDRFDAVVFDPPFAGAKLQAEALAAAKVARVVAVSCNPATLARDLAALVAGGYAVETVTPVDQFLWSAHVEVVAALSRR